MEADIPAEESSSKQMSFLEHLDELRRRLIISLVIVGIAFGFCFYFSSNIYNFLAIPVIRALADAQQQQISIQGVTGAEKILPLSSLKKGDKGKYIFEKETKLEVSRIVAGTTVNVVVADDAEGKLALYTDEPLFTGNAIVPKGIKLPINFSSQIADNTNDGTKMIVTTAQESFTLYITVSLYAAIALSMPFLLWQVWAFISPALYRHERAYVTPFIGLSSISFVIGAAFAYYILFPPAVAYLLWVGQDFNPMLRATDYFDLITIIMLAMGVIFQMPAITYVLARIGLVSAGILVRGWKIAIIVILIVAAVISPTGDATNLMLFAVPMFALYGVSILIAKIFGKKRQSDANMVT